MPIIPIPPAAPASLAEKGIRFVGAGVSGGEEGARNGPSIMPAAMKPGLMWKPILQAIAAKTPASEPCCVGWAVMARGIS